MPLAELTPGTSDWRDVKHAALILWKASQIRDVVVLQNDLRRHYMNSASTTIDIYTGINQGRKAILVHNHDAIVIAFQGSADNEIHMNLWTDGKGPNWWDLPYPVRFNGNRVHSFYLDMWNGMKTAVFSALGDAIAVIRDHDIVPKKLIIAGYSMGGGVSTPYTLWHSQTLLNISATAMALNVHLPKTGPPIMPLDLSFNTSRLRAQEQETGAISNSLTSFISGIRSELGHWDQTQFLPPYHFLCWRGHRYILPHEVTHQFGAGFGPQGHSIQGYYQAVEWMAEYGLDQVRSAYPSGYA